MKTISVAPMLIKTFVGVLTLQVVSLTAIHAQSGSRHHSKVPTSVMRLDSVSHDLVDTFERSLRGPGHKHHTRSQSRFLQAAKSFESNAHTLRSTIESDRGYRRAQEAVAQLRRSYNHLTEAAQGIRMSDRVRSNYTTVRSLMRDIERDREMIYASADPSRRQRHHGHQHDHHDRDRRPGLPGVLGRIFGK